MNSLIAFITSFGTEGEDQLSVNQVILILIIAILLLALWICIWISRKNRLYISQKSVEQEQVIFQEKEVV